MEFLTLKNISCRRTIGPLPSRAVQVLKCLDHRIFGCWRNLLYDNGRKEIGQDVLAEWEKFLELDKQLREKVKATFPSAKEAAQKLRARCATDEVYWPSSEDILGY